MAAAFERRNVLLLGLGQALYGTATTILFTLNGLVGHMLAADKALATLPVTAVMVGAALSTVPAAQVHRLFGRRVGFVLGALAGALGGAGYGLGIWLGDFWLFTAAALVTGWYFANAQFYRFAAAEAAAEARRPRAISLVMAGGVAAALAGPELVKYSKDLVLGLPFIGAYGVVVVLGLVAMGLMSALRLAPPPAADRHDSGRPLAVILRQPRMLAALATGIAAYASMSLVMTATPIAMVACSLTVEDAAFVIQWHSLAMFAPSFFTGRLIERFGVIPVIAAGLVLILACTAVALAGVALEHFWVALVLVGLGWNFAFVGATSLVTTCYEPAERTKTQAANDFLVFGVVSGASFLSGVLLNWTGWDGVPVATLPLALLALVLLPLAAGGRVKPPAQPVHACCCGGTCDHGD
ncbi:MFS transporter [Zavarzinia compransoris]|uniref:MFS transporter n=1 Tax=Zavarzinia compransoris TaxID=1264899 RepID=A0A317EBT4_9PROT|nr:MFS transporter [Zavarzinia compransoris]PWR23716.1 MFS transporter [Zavarzinia compransoris]TDP47940.1 putative MFS family arabinose efflux permease [Zavarzinia compransoris]